MSISTIQTIIDRASVATERSKLAVFALGNGDLDCVFANSIVAKCQMSNHNYNLIALLDGSQSEDTISNKLSRTRI